jgi:ketosteroid isomerase-like protein
VIGSNSQTDQQQIVALVEQEVHALSGGDPEDFFAILADDAVIMPPGIGAKKGTELRGWMRDFVERFHVEWLNWVSIETVVVGDLAFHTYAYSWRVTRKAGGTPTLAHGKGIHVFRRSPGEPWKLAREMWNASPAPPVNPNGSM